MRANTRTDVFLVGTVVSLLILAWTLPLEMLEYLSINVVGEPPINGLSWLQGVTDLGGEASMRMLATWGVGILLVGACIFLRTNPPRATHDLRAPARKVTSAELAVFFGITAAFFGGNLAIGYAWWDPAAPLGMGPLFWPSIASVILLGLVPTLVLRGFRLPAAEAFAGSGARMKENGPLLAMVAFGYGLISCIWHCCSLFNPTMFFFFFAIKFVQLWGMCRFFFYWGLPMLQQALHRPGVAAGVIALLFGFCYPWHTLGFALTFTLFGALLALITARTHSYWAGVLLLYLAYIFHAALPWHGADATLFLVQPLSAVVLGLAIYWAKLKSHKCIATTMK